MNPAAIKLAIEGVIAASLFLGGATLAWKYQGAKIALHEATIAAQTQTITNLLAAKKRDDSAVALAERLRDEATTKARTARDAMAAALLANHDWASQPVPKEVQDVLP